MKKTLSMLLAVIMVLALVPATVAFAEEVEPAGTITAYEKVGDEYIQVGTTYTTIDSAANAAGANGKIELSAGKFEFNGRQTIAVNGITLIGATDTDGKPASHLVTSSSYGNSSQTNRKALLAITATDVNVSNVIIDGGEYGRTLVPVYNDANTEFSVVRINSGSANFDNVIIKQSQRTLLTIGMESTSATFTATNLFCEGNNKVLPKRTDWNVFADIDVENGSFSCASGELDAYLQVGTHGSVSSMPAYHYNFERDLFFVPLLKVKTTAKHFVDSYKYIVAQGGAMYEDNVDEFRNVVCSELNGSVSSIVTDMCANPNHFGSYTVNGFIDVLEDAKNNATTLQKNKINGYTARLRQLFPAN